MKRGDIVLVNFPYADLVTIKKRPALIIQSDALQTDLNKVVIAQITSQLSRAGYPSHVLIRLNDPLAINSGLRTDSVILTDILATIDVSVIDRKIGALSNLEAINSALRITLGI